MIGPLVAPSRSQERSLSIGEIFDRAAHVAAGFDLELAADRLAIATRFS